MEGMERLLLLGQLQGKREQKGLNHNLKSKVHLKTHSAAKPSIEGRVITPPYIL